MEGSVPEWTRVPAMELDGLKLNSGFDAYQIYDLAQFS